MNSGSSIILRSALAALAVLPLVLSLVSTTRAAEPVSLSGPLPPGGRISDFWIIPGSDRVLYLADQTTVGAWELYSVPIAGGPPLKLSGNLAPNLDVRGIRFPPDESRVVFFTTQTASPLFDFYSVPVTGGTPVNYDVYSTFQFGPDSGLVYFGAENFPDDGMIGSVDLYNAPIAGGSSVKLLSVALSPMTSMSGFQITPDGSRVVYRIYYQEVGRWELYSIALTTPSPVKLKGGPGESVQEGFQISPDGSQVVHQVYRTADAVWDLYIVPVAGGTAVRLNDPLPRGGVARSEQFSPDGSRVVFLAGNELGPFELYSVPAGGGTPVRLNDPLVTGGSVWTYQISPDGSRVVYSADQMTDGAFELFSVPITGGTPVKLNGPLPEGGETSLFQISPDGSRVVYRAGDENGEIWELFSVPITGGAPVMLHGELAPGGTIFEFRISPDHRWVIYRIDYEDGWRWELFSAPIAGGVPVKLAGAPTNAPIDDAELSFQISLDSSRVVYYADQTTLGAYELYSVSISGGPMENYAAFTSFYGLTSVLDGDEDGDGLMNLIEYALGLNPAIPSTGDPGLPALTTVAGNHSFIFTMPAQGGQDVRIDIESSENLVTWEVLASRNGQGQWTGSVPVTLSPAGPDSEIAALTRPTDGDRNRSYRLVARLLP